MSLEQKGHRMQIIGGQQVIASEGYLENLIRFYRILFGRMTNEVRHTGDLTRYIAYQSTINDKESLCFLGIEVNSIEGIPEGMVAWDLNESTWSIWHAKNGQDVVVSQKDIKWHWTNKSLSIDGKIRCVGEFTVSSPLEFIPGANLEYYDFWISANAYVRGQEKVASNDEVYLADYDPVWPQLFEEIACWLQKNLPPEIAMRIEHYGSTAIEGMPAKPIIDVLVEIPSFSEAKRHVFGLFNNEEWEYWWYSDHMIFVKRNMLGGRRVYHVHMAPGGHKIWEGLAFRDHLVTDKADALRYAALKQELAVKYRDDREQYTEAKTIFVKEITSKALQGKSK